jgi:chaperonin GroEL
MSKVYCSGLSLQEKILSGVDKLADNVAATLGPKGRNVVLHRKGANPIITKDGVTVAQFVDLDDPVENSAAQIMKQAASETNAMAGDGTTTSTVLARAILKESQKYLMAGSSPVELKRGMARAEKAIIKEIESLSKPVESIQDIEHIATISANGDEKIGMLISQAVDKAGHGGSVLVDASKSTDTTLDLVEGFRLNSGYFAQAFVTDERKNAVVYEDALIFVTDYKVDNVNKILPVLELAARESRPLIIVAEHVEGQALAALIMNTVRGSMKVAAVKPPEYGKERLRIMEDLCITTGATFFSRTSGLNPGEIKLADFGVCERIEILKNSTTIMGGNTDVERLEKRIQSIKSEIKQTEDHEECKRLQHRVTRLSSGVAVVKVGGSTEIEMVEKKHRIEDALEAVSSAQEEGVVPGGGVALLVSRAFKIKAENEDQRLGAEIIRKALEAPLRQMARNAGESADIIIERISTRRGKLYGWDFKESKIVNMLTKGIIDPAKVTRAALQNAVSVASTLITTTGAIVEE